MKISGVESALCAAMEGREPSSPLPEGLSMLAPKKHAVILHSGFPVSQIFILLQGACAVTLYSADGGSDIADTMDSVQAFGLTELLCGKDVYHGTLYAASTGCRLLACPSRLFLETLKKSLPLSGLVNRYLAGFVMKTMSADRRRAFSSPRLAAAEFFYAYSQGKPLPCRVEISREELAQRLHLNLRTLYRHLSALKADGLVSIERGKTVLTQENADRLRALLTENSAF